MAEIGVFHPFRNFKFKLYLGEDPEPVAGVSKIGPLKQKTEAIMWRDGAHPYNSQPVLAGGTSCEPVAIEQGLGLDDGRFEDWALAAYDWKNGEGAFGKAKYRRDLRIEFLAMDGSLAETAKGGRKLNYVLKNAWVSEYQALPELDANSLNVIGIKLLTVQIEGFYRQQ